VVDGYSARQRPHQAQHFHLMNNCSPGLGGMLMFSWASHAPQIPTILAPSRRHPRSSCSPRGHHFKHHIKQTPTDFRFFLTRYPKIPQIDSAPQERAASAYGASLLSSSASRQEESQERTRISMMSPARGNGLISQAARCRVTTRVIMINHHTYSFTRELILPLRCRTPQIPD